MTAVTTGAVRPGVPERSLEQRMAALARANEIRSFRAGMKREVKADRSLARGLLMNPPEQLLTMKVVDLLLATPRVGRSKALRALAVAKCSPSKTLGGLTERQRQMLLGVLSPIWRV